MIQFRILLLSINAIEITIKDKIIIISEVHPFRYHFRFAWCTFNPLTIIRLFPISSDLFVFTRDAPANRGRTRAFMRVCVRARTRAAGRARVKRVKSNAAPTQPDLRARARESGGLIAGEAGAERATAASARSSFTNGNRALLRVAPSRSENPRFQRSAEE